jgi:hypothetical protein
MVGGNGRSGNGDLLAPGDPCPELVHSSNPIRFNRAQHGRGCRQERFDQLGQGGMGCGKIEAQPMGTERILQTAVQAEERKVGGPMA